jgi:MvdD family ATP-grasp ribosomal peptide maturase
MTILIVTHSQDNESISLVQTALAQKGQPSFRFDTDRFPTEVQLDVYYQQNQERLTLTDGEQSLDLQDVSAIWYRRNWTATGLPATMDLQLRQASMKESRATVLGMIVSLDAFHLDPLAHLRRAENKQLQLKIAREIGIEIPKTLITNNPKAVKEFAQDCPTGIITKMLSSFAIYEEGKEKVVFTNPVTPEDLEHLEGLKYCPMTFQEQVPKALELRTIIVGNQLFTASIDSQRLEKAHHDWRKQGLEFLEDWQPYQLPIELEAKLLQLMEQVGLNYGAIDLILTPEGRYLFLEVNPVGEFFWLELCPGLPVSHAIAQLLIDRMPR